MEQKAELPNVLKMLDFEPTLWLSQDAKIIDWRTLNVIVKPIIEFWKMHQGAIIASVISACIGAIITQTFSVYTLTRAVKYQRNHEILTSTRLGIGFLKRVESEIDENLNQLMNHEYEVVFQFGEPTDRASLMQAFIGSDQSSTNAAGVNAFLKYMRSMSGITVHVDKMDLPAEQLSTTAWEHGAPDLADIDYDLLRELSDYYMLAERINASIRALSQEQLEPGGFIAVEYSKRLNSIAAAHNENVAKIKQKDTILLKNKIAKEMQRLSELRARTESFIQ